MKSKALFICENIEELNDLSEVAKSLEGETTIIDITSIYGKSKTNPDGFDNWVVIENSRNDFYGSWSLALKIKIIIKIYLIALRVVLVGKHNCLYSGIPIISARLIKFTFPNMVYYSYIRSVFQPRAGQNSIIWRALCAYKRFRSLKPFKADHYFVTGKASRNMLRKIGVPDEDITISGSITLSKYFPDFKKTLGAYKGILYLSGAHKWHGDDSLECFQRKLVEELKIIAEEEEVEFRIRPHPRDCNHDYYKEFSELDHKSSNDSLSYFSGDGNWLVVSNFSMMGFEFEYLGLTSVFVAPKFAVDSFKEWFEATSSQPFTDVSIIRDILRGKVCVNSNLGQVYQRIDNPIKVIGRYRK